MEVLFDFNTLTRKPQIISDYLNQIRELFSAEDKSMIFLRKRTGRNIPTRKYAITNKGCFDLPLFEEICKQIIENFPSLKIKCSQTFLDKIQNQSISDSLVKLNITPRDYQLESALTALKKGNGVIVLPTSAGKTLVIALIASTILSQTTDNILILVPDIQLVQQTYQDFLDYGISTELISKWTGNNEFVQTKIVIANNQILLSEKQDKSVLDKFNAVIVDECHKMATADKISKLIKSLKTQTR